MAATIVAVFLASCAPMRETDRYPDRKSDRRSLYRYEYTQVHMGVQARIVLYAPDREAAERGAVAAFDRIAALDAIMSDYRRDSELMHLAGQSGAGPIPVSADLFHVLRAAERLARLSGGAFDITAGPLVQLWRKARDTGALPAPDTLEIARSQSGYALLRLDPEDSTATLASKDMRLDLGGVAKGFAADEALAILRAHGLPRAMIEFGGDIVTGDAPPREPDAAGSPENDKAGWRITEPLSGRTFHLANAAISTSGDTVQFVVIDGVRYSHVLDPRTGVPLTSRIAVTVIAPEGILSDGLATMLSVLGPEAGMDLVERTWPDVQAFFDDAGAEK